MGHFYRSINLAEGLEQVRLEFIFYLNNHDPSIQILVQRGFKHRVVDLKNHNSNWEASLIRRDGISLWVNDRLDTYSHHAKNIKEQGIPLMTFDDRGTGASFADLHVAALAFDSQEALGGTRLLRGARYLILNPEINNCTRVRTQVDSILVTLGGSDTYGVTVKVVKILKKLGLTATIVLGPAFSHHTALNAEITDHFTIKHGVPSMMKEYLKHDLAITGGGITPFEANASGLPCIVVANELFEIPVGIELARLGGSIFAGHYESIKPHLITKKLLIEQMSLAGMKSIDLKGTQRVINAVKELLK
jgi:spore coat polysaccharide biosynthesis predicted glycosyltransferase SpsG